MTATPLAISDLYDLVGYLDESIRSVTAGQARVVLVSRTLPHLIPHRTDAQRLAG